jgi:hypothetical protein
MGDHDRILLQFSVTIDTVVSYMGAASAAGWNIA